MLWGPTPACRHPSITGKGNVACRLPGILLKRLIVTMYGTPYPQSYCGGRWMRLRPAPARRRQRPTSNLQHYSR